MGCGTSRQTDREAEDVIFKSNPQVQEQIERPSLFQNSALFPVREKDGLITIIDSQQTTTCVSGDAVLQESVHVSQVMLEPPVEEFITEFSPDDDPEASVSEMLRAFQHLSRRVDGCLQILQQKKMATPMKLGGSIPSSPVTPVGEKAGTATRGFAVLASDSAPGPRSCSALSAEQHELLASPSAQQEFRGAADAYAGGRVLEAFDRVNEACLQCGTSYEVAASDWSQPGLDLRALAEERGHLVGSLETLRSDEGWALVRDDHLKALYRSAKGSGVHSFKLSASFECPLENLLAMAREIDLCNCLSDILTGTILHQPSLFEGTFHIFAKTPWPFPKANLLLHAKGADLAKEHGCALILLKNADEAALPAGSLDTPAADVKSIRMNVAEGSCILLSPLPPTKDGRPRTQGYMMVHLTSSMHVPAAWIRLLLKLTAPWIHRLVQRGLDNNFGAKPSPLQARQQERPSLYQLARSRVLEFSRA